MACNKPGPNNNVKVMVKIRPLIGREIESHEKICWKKVADNEIVELDAPTPTKPCIYDHVFGGVDPTQAIYDMAISHIVDSCVQGFNGSVMAYGQTASGKTYTMMGDESNLGIIRLVAENIFDMVEKYDDRDIYMVRCSFLEIYNEKINDLLNPDKTNLEVIETQDGAVMIKDATEKVVRKAKNMIELIEQGNATKQIGETAANDRSSRSHTIFRIMIESQEAHEDGASIKMGILDLVDLAGSESINKSKASGDRLKEGISINKSLLELGRVIKELSEKKEGEDKFIVFRNSKLTRVIQHSLGGNAKSVVICTVSPAEREETRNTLRFASRAKNIKNSPKLNEILSDQAMIKRLNEKISGLRKQIAQMARNQGSGQTAETRQDIIERIEKCEMQFIRSKKRKQERRRQTWHYTPNIMEIKQDSSETEQESFRELMPPPPPIFTTQRGTNSIHSYETFEMPMFNGVDEQFEPGENVNFHQTPSPPLRIHTPTHFKRQLSSIMEGAEVDKGKAAKEVSPKEEDLQSQLDQATKQIENFKQEQNELRSTLEKLVPIVGEKDKLDLLYQECVQKSSELSEQLASKDQEIDSLKATLADTENSLAQKFNGVDEQFEAGENVNFHQTPRPTHQIHTPPLFKRRLSAIMEGVATPPIGTVISTCDRCKVLEGELNELSDFTKLEQLYHVHEETDRSSCEDFIEHLKSELDEAKKVLVMNNAEITSLKASIQDSSEGVSEAARSKAEALKAKDIAESHSAGIEYELEALKGRFEKREAELLGLLEERNLETEAIEKKIEDVTEKLKSTEKELFDLQLSVEANGMHFEKILKERDDEVKVLKEKLDESNAATLVNSQSKEKLHIKISELEVTLRDKEEQLAINVKTISDLESLRSSKDLLVSELENKVSELQTKFQEAETQVEPLNTSKDLLISDLQAKICELQEAQSHSKDLISELEAKVSQFQSNVQEAETQIEAFSSTKDLLVAELEAKVTELESELQEVRNQSKDLVTEFEAKISELQTKLDETEIQFEQFKTQTISAVEITEEVRTKTRESRGPPEVISDTITSICADDLAGDFTLNSTNGTMINGGGDESPESMSDMSKEIEVLQGELKQARADLKDLKKKNKELQSEYDETSMQLLEAIQDYDALKAELDKGKAAKEVSQKEEDLHSQLDQATKQIENFKQELNELRSTLEKLVPIVGEKDKLDLLYQELVLKSSELSEQLASKNQEIDSLKATLADTENSLAQKLAETEDISELKIKLDALEKEASTAKNSLNEKEVENQHLVTKIQIIQTTIENTEELRSELDEIKSRLERTVNEVNSVKSSLVDAEAQVKKTSEKLVAVQGEKEELLEKIVCFGQEREQLTQEQTEKVNVLQEELLETLDMLHEMEAESQEIVKLRAKVSELQEQISTLSEEREALVTQQTKYEMASKHNATLIETLKSKQMSLITEIEQLQTFQKESSVEIATVKNENSKYKTETSDLIMKLATVEEKLALIESKYEQALTELTSCKNTLSQTTEEVTKMRQSVSLRDQQLHEAVTKLKQLEAEREQHTKDMFELDDLRKRTVKDRRSRRQSAHDELRPLVRSIKAIAVQTEPADESCQCRVLNEKLEKQKIELLKAKVKIDHYRLGNDHKVGDIREEKERVERKLTETLSEVNKWHQEANRLRKDRETLRQHLVQMDFELKQHQERPICDMRSTETQTELQMPIINMNSDAASLDQKLYIKKLEDDLSLQTKKYQDCKKIAQDRREKIREKEAEIASLQNRSPEGGKENSSNNIQVSQLMNEVLQLKKENGELVQHYNHYKGLYLTRVPQSSVKNQKSNQTQTELSSEDITNAINERDLFEAKYRKTATLFNVVKKSQEDYKKNFVIRVSENRAFATVLKKFDKTYGGPPPIEGLDEMYQVGYEEWKKQNQDFVKRYQIE